MKAAFLYLHGRRELLVLQVHVTLAFVMHSPAEQLTQNFFDAHRSWIYFYFDDVAIVLRVGNCQLAFLCLFFFFLRLLLWFLFDRLLILLWTLHLQTWIFAFGHEFACVFGIFIIDVLIVVVLFVILAFVEV